MEVFFHSFSEIKETFPQGWFFCCYTRHNQSLNISSNFLSDISNNSISFPSEIDFNIMPNVHKSDNKFIDNVNSSIEVNSSINKVNNLKNEKLHVHGNILTEHNYFKAIHVKNEIDDHNYAKSAKRFCGKHDERDKREQPNNYSGFNPNFDISALEFPNRGKIIMNKFHNRLNTLRLNQCLVCEESWFHITYNKCGRCKRDNVSPPKFSVGNSMIPAELPKELEELTQTEEMLIARAFPVMNVYCKPRGGQRAYKGHVVTFPSNLPKAPRPCQ